MVNTGFLLKPTRPQLDTNLIWDQTLIRNNLCNKKVYIETKVNPRKRIKIFNELHAAYIQPRTPQHNKEKYCVKVHTGGNLMMWHPLKL